MKPSRLRQLLGLLLTPQTRAKTATAQALIGCTGYPGPVVPLERMSSPVALVTKFWCCVP